MIVAAGSKEALLSGMKMAAKMGKVCMFAGLPKNDPEVSIDVNARFPFMGLSLPRPDIMRWLLN